MQLAEYIIFFYKQEIVCPAAVRLISTIFYAQLAILATLQSILHGVLVRN